MKYEKGMLYKRKLVEGIFGILYKGISLEIRDGENKV